MTELLLTHDMRADVILERMIWENRRKRAQSERLNRQAAAARSRSLSRQSGQRGRG